MREVDAGKEAKDQRTRHIEFIRASSQILDLTFETAIIAGENAVEMKKKVAGWGSTLHKGLKQRRPREQA